MTLALARAGRGVRPILFLALGICAACSKSPEALEREHLSRGDGYFTQEKYYNAIIEYRIAVQLDGNSGEARKKLGRTYLRVNDVDHAFDQYARAADLLPDDIDVQLTAGKLHHLAGRFEDAKTRADNVLRKDPRNVEAEILFGSALVGLKDVDGAISELEGALKLDPNQSRIYTALGAFELTKGRTEQAEATFRRAIELDPQSPKVHVALGYYFWAMRRVPEAEAAFKRALQLDPKNLLVNRILATLFLTTNRVAEAEDYLKTLAVTAPSYRLSLADYYLANGRIKEATRIVSQTSTEGENASEVKLRFAAIAVAEGRTPDANGIIDDVLSREPNNSSALLAKAQILLAANRSVDALIRVERAAESDPKNLAVHYTLGKLHALRSEYREAIKAFNEVLQINPRAVAAQEELARLYLMVGNPKDSVNASRAALRARPDSGDLHLLLARGLLDSGNTRSAEQEAQGLLTKYPDSAAVYTLWGAIYQAKSDTAGARRSFERALQLDHDDRDALTELVTLEVQANHNARAMELVDAELAKAPSDPRILELAARARATTGDLRRAEELLKRLISVDSSNLSAYGMLGQLYMSEKRLGDARAEYERALVANPDSVALQTIVAMILEAENRSDEARRRYERILEKEPNAVVAANNLAWMYVERAENVDLALQLAQRAKQQLPADPRVNDTLGWIYYKKNLIDQAIPLLEDGVRGDAKNPLHQHHLGMAYFQSGDWPKARESLERALKLGSWFPGIDDARKALAITGS